MPVLGNWMVYQWQKYFNFYWLMISLLLYFFYCLQTFFFREIVKNNSIVGSKTSSQFPEILQSKLETIYLLSLSTGWLSGSVPTALWESTDVKFCFSTTCRWSTLGKVTNCGAFFVYYLVDAPHCSLRYCASN